MTIREPSFSLGIEEEYLLVDLETLDLAAAPDALMNECIKQLENKVSPEFLQCQIEVGTGVCKTVAEAHLDLAHLRRTIADVSAEYGLVPLAVSTHPSPNGTSRALPTRSAIGYWKRIWPESRGAC